jgi:hypothetical protein
VLAELVGDVLALVVMVLDCRQLDYSVEQHSAKTKQNENMLKN